MFTRDQLLKQFAACQSDPEALDDFEDWFRTNSKGAYAASDSGVREAFASVEAALSKYHFEGLDAAGVVAELTAALSPSAQGQFVALGNAFRGMSGDSDTAAAPVRIEIEWSFYPREQWATLAMPLRLVPQCLTV